jgi:hypothetical protein
MAEALGVVSSALTLAGLFKICIEAFDLIRTMQNQEVDLKKLTLRLNIEKCRLYTWGETMGLTRPARGSKPRPLDSCPFQDIVKESLDFILQLFNNTHRLKDKYGCREADSAQALLTNRDESSTVKHLAASFGNFRISGQARDRVGKVLQKTFWVIHDRKKFHLLIQEAKELIDGIQDVTKGLSSITQQDNMIKSHVMNIRDVETLDMVADVCEVDHPKISDAASTRADTISMATTHRNHIVEWTETVVSEESDDTTVADMESLTVTELKHLLRNAQERIRRSNEVAVRTTLSSSNSTAPYVPEQERVRTGLSSSTIEQLKEVEQYEILLEQMAAATLDQEFMDEFSAIKAWFRVLSDAERTAAAYGLLQQTTPMQQRFFAETLNQMAKRQPVNSEGERGKL